MTISIQISTGPHKARISRTGHDDIVIGPDATQHFAAWPGMVVSVAEEEADTGVHTESGGNGPPPVPPKPIGK